MKYVFTKGTWGNAKNMKFNQEDKYYAVTIKAKSINQNIFDGKHWRYFNDQWEFYSDGKWKPLANPKFEVIAYIEIFDLKPFESKENENE